MSAVSEPVTYSTDYWVLALPEGWRHEPAEGDGSFSVESVGGDKKIHVRIVLPSPKEHFDSDATLARFEEIIAEAGRTLEPAHDRILDERGSAGPYATRLIASYGHESHFGLAAMTFVTANHQLWISVHDYWSEDRGSFERFFRDIFQCFHPVPTNET